jgi:NTP pyrophosphatase (non-canonical NTP hydrolase)
MEIKQLQKEIDDMIKAWGGYFDELTNIVLVMEEVGEISRIMSREFGGQKWKKGENENESLEDEIVDAMYALICIANQRGYDLESAFKRNMDKKTGRDKDRFNTTK